MVNVSIIIPIYNVEPFIEECVNSVLNQTMTENIECILVDDCGSDKSFEVAESIIASYKGDIKFKLIRHEVNKGLSCARNGGVNAAEGKYIFFIDSDDYIMNDCIETLWALANKYPEADMVCSTSLSLNGKQNEDFHLCHTKHHLPEFSNDVKFIRREFALSHYPIQTPNKLIKREFLVKNNISFIENVVFEDFAWLLDCSQKLKAIALSAKDTYFYRQNNSSIMNSITKKYMISVAKVSDHLLAGIDTDDFYRMELFKILEFMHIYDEKIKLSPLPLMEFGKNRIFCRLYRSMYAKNSLFNKIYKELLINLFRINVKLKK